MTPEEFAEELLRLKASEALKTVKEVIEEADLQPSQIPLSLHLDMHLFDQLARKGKRHCLNN